MSPFSRKPVGLRRQPPAVKNIEDIEGTVILIIANLKKKGGDRPMQSNPQLDAPTQQELEALQENWRQIRQLLEQTVPQILRYLADFKQLRARYNRDQFNCDARLDRLIDRVDGQDMRLTGFEERLKAFQNELARLKQG